VLFVRVLRASAVRVGVCGECVFRCFEIEIEEEEEEENVYIFIILNNII